MNPYQPMTDEELDRAIEALPLATPPVGLRASILALTIHAPAHQPLLRPWEIVGLGSALGMSVWVTLYLVLSHAPIVPASVSFLSSLSLAFSDVHTAAWLALGAVVACWVTLVDGSPRFLTTAASIIRRGS